MKPPSNRYALIPPLPTEGGFYQHFPGVYCEGCGETFALYSYSAMRPDGVDEQGKPFYRSCFKCPPEPSREKSSLTPTTQSATVTVTP